MKNLLFVAVICCLFSCKESGVKLAKPSTFVRYFNGGFADSAQNVIETSDNGFLILANSTVSNTQTRIVLVKTDAYGNQIQRETYSASDPNHPNLSGFGMAELPDKTGYLIVGQNINSDRTPNGLFIMKVSTDLKTITDSITYKTIYDSASQNNVKIQGVACQFYPSMPTKFVVLGKDFDDAKVSGGVTTTWDMFLGEFNISDLSKNWTRFYGQGSTKLTHQLIIDDANKIYWGGTNTDAQGQTKMIISSATPNNTSNSSTPIPSTLAASANMTCNYFCQYGTNFGLVGSYSTASSGGKYDNAIFFHADGTLVPRDSTSFRQAFPLSSSLQSGNSICATQDGGFLILGTVANDIAQSDTDYILYHVNLTGTVVSWTKKYGGKSKDIGVKIIRTSDGSYAVLGTTILANVATVFFMKTDSQGEIQ